MPRFRYEDYADAFRVGQLLTRVDLANHFGVGRSTAGYHLDRAVSAGFLNRAYGWTGLRSGWLYGLPETMPRLEGT